jgi:hypothetical protein
VPRARTAAPEEPPPDLFKIAVSYCFDGGCWPPGLVTVVSVVKPVSEALLHAEVLVVVVDVLQLLDGLSAVVAVPQSFVLAAWAGARPDAKIIAVPHAKKASFIESDFMAHTSLVGVETAAPESRRPACPILQLFTAVWAQADGPQG